MALSAAQIESAVERAYGHYVPEAVKRGRNPAFPYVPVYRFADKATCKAQTTQIKKRAYATREEALACASRVIEGFKRHMRERLNMPGCRALREQYGLPREL